MPDDSDEIRQTVADHGQAARNAIEAGFDGVQIQANYLYLIAQFFNKTTNRRTDKYGGSIQNRARLFFEILETVLRHVASARVGVKTRPMNDQSVAALAVDLRIGDERAAIERAEVPEHAIAGQRRERGA